jgi:hypothetical protein
VAAAKTSRPQEEEDRHLTHGGASSLPSAWKSPRFFPATDEHEVRNPVQRSLSGASGLASAVIPLAGAPISLCRPLHFFVHGRRARSAPLAPSLTPPSPVSGRKSLTGSLARETPDCSS